MQFLGKPRKLVEKVENKIKLRGRERRQGKRKRERGIERRT